MKDLRWQIANLVRDQLIVAGRADLNDRVSQIASLAHDMRRLDRLARMLSLARQRAFDSAARILVQQASRTLTDLRYRLEVASRSLDQPQAPILSLREIVGEMDQLEEEFEGWHYDGPHRILSIETDPIELEDVYLGPFAVRLCLGDLVRTPRSFPFEVEALDPHPAAGNDHVTHPHVSDNKLCAGDATTPLTNALMQGRLCDFFLIVRQALTTYNPHSPYVPLEQWDGDPCSDCGYRMTDEDRYCCEVCGGDFCSECISGCARCDISCCRGCLSTCPHCEESVCNECLNACAECGEPCCTGCLSDDLCPDCHDKLENEDEKEEHQPAGGQATGNRTEPAPAKVA